MVRFWAAGLAAFLLAAAPVYAAPSSNGITVLAAASLTDALSEIGRDYEAKTHRHVAVSFAGSMILAKQIEASAGADMFISADEDSMNYLDMRGLLATGTRFNLLSNALVLVAPANSKAALTIAPKFPLAAALMGGRLAVANVDTVPAGRYAKASLTSLGVWDVVSGKLAQGEDVRATLAYVARGEAPFGIVYATDAHAESKVRLVDTFAENTHPPILYPAALTKGAKREAAQFLAYLKTEPARAVFQKAWFTVLSDR